MPLNRDTVRVMRNPFRRRWIVVYRYSMLPDFECGRYFFRWRAEAVRRFYEWSNPPIFHMGIGPVEVERLP